jgi:hypothetical protein
MLQKQQQAALAANRPLKLRMQVRSFDAVCHMVASGLGVAILPKGATLPIIKSMKLGWRPLADAWAQRRLLAATMAGQPDAAIAALVDFLVAPPGPGRSKAHPAFAKRERQGPKAVMDGAGCGRHTAAHGHPEQSLPTPAARARLPASKCWNWAS